MEQWRFQVSNGIFQQASDGMMTFLVVVTSDGQTEQWNTTSVINYKNPYDLMWKKADGWLKSAGPG